MELLPPVDESNACYEATSYIAIRRISICRRGSDDIDDVVDADDWCFVRPNLPLDAIMARLPPRSARLLPGLPGRNRLLPASQRMSKYTLEPIVMLLICRKLPVNAIINPPNEPYTVTSSDTFSSYL